jgi:hypothetical protein
MLKKLLLILMLSTVPILAQTEEVKNLDKYKGEGAFVLEVDGETGVWMPLNMAKRALAASELVRGLELKQDLLQLKIDVRGERIEACKSALSFANDSREKAMEAFKMQSEVISDLEDEKDSWYRKPIVWTGVGAVLVIAVEVGLFFFVSSM